MKHYAWVKEEINKLLNAKVICSSHFSWSTPIIVVAKGNDGICPVINYQVLNKFLRMFVWAMAKVKDIFPKLSCAKYFCTLDL